VRDSIGNPYGTAHGGGAYNYGSVFKIDTAGTETTLHSFTGGTSDGCFPAQGLVTDKSGNLYGKTALCGAYGNGQSPMSPLVASYIRVDAEEFSIVSHISGIPPKRQSTSAMACY
jgi:uncharacterized repeat protein (TIGR03803 family)